MLGMHEAVGSNPTWSTYIFFKTIICICDFMIKAILFDIGEVVIEEDFIGFFAKLEEERKLKTKTLYKSILHVDAWVEYNKGMITEDQLIDSIVKKKDVDRELLEYIKNNWRKILSPNKKIVDLIKKLKKNYKVYALSNVDKETVKYIQDRWKIYDIFDGEILSCDIGMVKPDKDIFDYALKVSGCKNNEILFIDNYGINIRAAESFGIKSIKYESFEQLVNDLKHAGIHF